MKSFSDFMKESLTESPAPIHELDPLFVHESILHAKSLLKKGLAKNVGDNQYHHENEYGHTMFHLDDQGPHSYSYFHKAEAPGLGKVNVHNVAAKGRGTAENIIKNMEYVSKTHGPVASDNKQTKGGHSLWLKVEQKHGNLVRNYEVDERGVYKDVGAGVGEAYGEGKQNIRHVLVLSKQ